MDRISYEIVSNEEETGDDEDDKDEQKDDKDDEMWKMKSSTLNRATERFIRQSF